MTDSQKSSSSLSASDERLNIVLCAIIRGEPMEWPPEADTAYYEAFLNRAKYHGVDSLICHLLKPTAVWEGLPDSLKGGLIQAIRDDAAYEMVRSRDLIALGKVLRRAGVPIVLLKGGALAYTHYPKPYLRARGDTDLFINIGDIQRIQDVFLDMSYQISGSIYKSHQFNCLKDAAFNIVINYDVHWRSSNAPEYARVISFEEGIRGSVAIPDLDGFPALDPEHALLLACMHRAGNPHHDPDRLIWIYDIHLMISEMPESSLLRFSERAVTEGVQAACLQAMRKTRHCFATRVPDNVIEILSNSSDAVSIGRRFAKSYTGLIIDDLRCLPDTRSRFGLIRELLMPSAGEMLQKYNKQNDLWLPALYFRYLLDGLVKRISLR